MVPFFHSCSDLLPLMDGRMLSGVALMKTDSCRISNTGSTFVIYKLHQFQILPSYPRSLRNTASITSKRNHQ